MAARYRPDRPRNNACRGDPVRVNPSTRCDPGPLRVIGEYEVRRFEAKAAPYLNGQLIRTVSVAANQCFDPFLNDKAGKTLAQRVP